MRKFGLAVAVMLVTLGMSQAQVTFDGPKEGKPGKPVFITLKEVKGDDLKLTVLFNGMPADPTEYRMMKDADDKKLVYLFTDNEGLYTFVAGTNTTGKTNLSTYTYKSVNPTPPAPVIADDLKAMKDAYAKSPDAANLAKMKELFSEITSGSYTNYADLEQDFAAAGKKFLADGALKDVRTEITKYLSSKLGTNGAKIDVANAVAEFKKVLAALETLK